MLPTPTYVIGDAHLGVASDSSERQLLKLLHSVPSDGHALVIMGDLFDFWFAWKHAIPRVGFRILAALADLRDAGIPVVWIGGNHDCWGGAVLESETGVTYTLDPWRNQIGSWDTLLMHGDGLRVSDAPYRRLRSVLRHPASITAFSWLHPNIATWLAMKSSGTSRSARAKDGGVELKSVAEQAMLEADAPALVIHGHSHVPALERLSHGVYANAGAWYLDHQYLRIEDDLITLNQWHIDSKPTVIKRLRRL